VVAVAVAVHPAQLWVLDQSSPVVVEVAAEAVEVEVEAVEVEVEAVEVEVEAVAVEAVEAEAEALLSSQQPRVVLSGLGAFGHCLAPFDHVLRCAC
jgi:hypothetical protein